MRKHNYKIVTRRSSPVGYVSSLHPADHKRYTQMTHSVIYEVLLAVAITVKSRNGFPQRPSHAIVMITIYDDDDDDDDDFLILSLEKVNIFR